MRLGHLTNGISCEYKMQSLFKEWLIKKELLFVDEFYVSNVSRRPDFLILKDGNKLINVEAKCNNLDTLVRQMVDNALYCDYTFAFIPDYCNTPEWFKEKLLNSKYGVIIYNFEHEIITEVLEAHKNKYIERPLRKYIINKIKQKYKTH